jgi:hypothetical protein
VPLLALDFVCNDWGAGKLVSLLRKEVMIITKNKKLKDAVVELIGLEESLADVNKRHLPEHMKETENVEPVTAAAIKCVRALKDLIKIIELERSALKPIKYFYIVNLGIGDLDKQLALLKKGKLPCPRCSRALDGYEDLSEVKASLAADGDALLICNRCGAEIRIEDPESEELMF